MTPDQIQQLERTLREGQELLRRMGDLRQGLEVAQECDQVLIQFSPRFAIEVLKPGNTRMIAVCWAERELGERAEELRMALIEVVKARLATIESELDALSLPESA